MTKVELFLGKKLLEMGISPSLKGFNLIISFVEKEIELDSNNTMELYEILAKENGTNSHCIERNIRSAFDSANKETATYKALFGDLKQTNSTRLSTLGWITKGALEG